MLIERHHAAQLGHETRRILEAGRYETPGGKTVAIGDLVRRAVEETSSYPPDHALPAVPLRRRIARVLAVAALHGHEALVLGAWGCGAFGNDTQEIADLFKEALAGSYRGVFARVVFAITDWSEERRFIEPFQTAFAG